MWPVWALSSWPLYPLDESPQFFEHCLTFWYKSMFLIHHVPFLLQCWYQPVLQVLVLFSWESGCYGFSLLLGYRCFWAISAKLANVTHTDAHFEFLWVLPTPIQHQRVHSRLLPFPMCDHLSQQWEACSHYIYSFVFCWVLKIML